MIKFKGFTLTELMVALAVIGIIVAVVTPAIMRTRPNKNKMMIKKAYYTTENTVSNLINDTSLYADMRDVCISGNEDVANGIYCAYGFDWDEEVTYNGVKFSGNTKFQRLFAEQLNVSQEIESNSEKFMTTDGIIWDFSDIPDNNGWSAGTAPSENVRTLSIDVNGAEGPNCYQADCTNPEDFDMFRIDIQSNGKMKVNDADTLAAGYVTINASVTK